MANFIRVDKGERLVNLDHVVCASWSGHGGWKLLDRDDAVLGVVAHADELQFVVVPAAAGCYATIIGCSSHPDGARPTKDEIYVERAPVIAWRIDPGSERPSGAPIVAGTLSGYCHVFVERPDGSLDDENLGSYSKLDEARAGVLMGAQYEWDREKFRKGELTNASPRGESA